MDMIFINGFEKETSEIEIADNQVYLDDDNDQIVLVLFKEKEIPDTWLCMYFCDTGSRPELFGYSSRHIRQMKYLGTSSDLDFNVSLRK